MGNKTQWAYDADDRVTTLTQPNGGTVTYVYDNDDELTDTTDADGRRTTFSYDADGDQTGETWVGASPSRYHVHVRCRQRADRRGRQLRHLTFTYDSGGNETHISDVRPGTGQPSVT